MFGFIVAALLADFALYLTNYPFLWLLPPCFYLLERFQTSPVRNQWLLSVVLVIVRPINAIGARFDLVKIEVPHFGWIARMRPSACWLLRSGGV